MALPMAMVLVSAAMVAGGSVPTPDNARCSRVTQCNGIMCKDTCAVGSVVVDPWVDEALLFQRNLQMVRRAHTRMPLAPATPPATLLAGPPQGCALLSCRPLTPGPRPPPPRTTTCRRPVSVWMCTGRASAPDHADRDAQLGDIAGLRVRDRAGLHRRAARQAPVRRHTRLLAPPRPRLLGSKLGVADDLIAFTAPPRVALHRAFACQQDASVQPSPHRPLPPPSTPRPLRVEVVVVR